MQCFLPQQHTYEDLHDLSTFFTEQQEVQSIIEQSVRNVVSKYILIKVFNQSMKNHRIEFIQVDEYESSNTVGEISLSQVLVIFK